MNKIFDINKGNKIGKPFSIPAIIMQVIELTK